jgi:hypothetical protein
VWYPKEIRVLKYNPTIFSYKDAQGFRKAGNQKLQVAQINATVYHYGYVKPPVVMQQKLENSSKFYKDDNWIRKTFQEESFDYSKNIIQLKKFDGTHPAPMRSRIQRINWEFDYEISFSKKSFKKRVKSFLKKNLGIDLGYKNYILKRE